MTNPNHPRPTDILLFDGVNLLDVAGPVQAFEAANAEGRAAYAPRFVSAGAQPVRASCGLPLLPSAAFSAQDAGHDLLIPGGAGIDHLNGGKSILQTVQAYHAGGGRIISVCSGALVLAAAGILDGLPATTHWSRRAQTRNYPDVVWDLDRISTAAGQVYTSAGVTTGIDLALAIIQQDCGPSVALAVARELVVQLRRTGGQSQYAFYLAGQFSGNDTLAALIEEVVANPRGDWTIDRLADVSGLHPRTLTRKFKRDVEMTPAHFVEKVRVDHARTLLQQELPLKRVAAESGFGDLQRMRRAFQRQLGVQVSDYRTMFV